MPVAAVIDTSVLLSGFLWTSGPPFRCVELAQQRRIESVTCEQILDEFQAKLRIKFGYSAEGASAAADQVRSFSRVVAISGALKVVAADPKDDMVIECAVIGKAGYVISGDTKHLVRMGSYGAIRIMLPADFLATVPGDILSAP